MTGFIALWSHLLAAALYGALAVYQLRRWHGDAAQPAADHRLRGDVGVDDLPRPARPLHLSSPSSPRAAATSPSSPSCTAC